MNPIDKMALDEFLRDTETHKMMAKTLHALHRELVRAGFTRDEALTLVITMTKLGKEDHT